MAIGIEHAPKRNGTETVDTGDSLGRHYEKLYDVGSNVLDLLVDQFCPEVATTKLKAQLSDEYRTQSRQYESALMHAGDLADLDFRSERRDESRLPEHNIAMTQAISRFNEIYSPDCVIPGFGMKIVFTQQHGYLKTLLGVAPDNADIHDLLGNGAATNLGVGHPLISILPILENKLQIAGFKGEYLHPSIPSLTALDLLTRIHPGFPNEDIVIRPGFQVTTVASGVVENVCAYADKKVYDTGSQQTEDLVQAAISDDPRLAFLFTNDHNKNRKILLALGLVKTPVIYAIEGTCLGGIGSARGGTFDFTEAQDLSRGIAGGYVQKMLPMPTTEQHIAEFLEITRDGIRKKNVAGVVIEPVLGDGGIHALEDNFMGDLIAILREGYEGKSIPLIIDATQTCAGRAGGIIGIDHLPSLQMYLDETIYILGKSISGGERPFAFSLTPGKIAKEAYPLTHISTTGGRHALDAVATTMFLAQPEIQEIIDHNADILQEEAGKFGVNHLLNGIKLHRGFELGTEGTHIAQRQLLVDHGILTGKVGKNSEVLRTNFGLLYDPITFRKLAAIVCGVSCILLTIATLG